MTDLASGAIVGAVAGEVVKAILAATETIAEFKPHFEQLKETVESLTLTVHDVQSLHDELGADAKSSDRTLAEKNINQLLMHLRDAKELINNCSKVKRNIWKKYVYCKKLQKLDSDLQRFSNMNMQAEAWVDRKRNLAMTKEVIRKLSSMSISSSIHGGSSYSSSSGGDFAYSTSALPELPRKIVGLNTSLEELKDKVLSEYVFVIEVYALGGCGKTTLVTKLCQDEEVKAKFQEIVFITVSQSPNLMEICLRLWTRLVDANFRPTFMDENDAINLLTDNLNKRRKWSALVVLDDVWSEGILEKLLFRNAGIKVVVTSRIRFKTIDSAHSLKFLGPDDAMDLFCHWAFAGDQTSNKVDNELVKQIVEGCRGLPLALKVIGSSLREEPIRKWRQRARLLQQGGQIFEDKSILDCLSTSLISLEEKHRECFMDLGAFPEDEKISAASILDMWIEIHDLSEDDAYVTLLEFFSRNLVTLVERTRCSKGMTCDIDDSFSDMFVIQHDLLRELAIHTSQMKNRYQNARLFMNQVDLPNKQKQRDQTSMARIVSINTDQMGPWNWFDMSFPSAEVLVLNFSAKLYSLPPFLEKMESLKVLIIANHSSGIALPSNLPSLGSLRNLRRVRLERVSVPFVSIFREPLPNLQKLSMFFCEVSQLENSQALDIPRLFPMMSELELDYCKGFETLPPGICSLSILEKLSITNCPDFTSLPEGIGLLNKLEALRLRACTSLEGLPDSLCKLESLKLLDLSHCSKIESFPDKIGELNSLEKIDMSWSSVNMLPASVTSMKSLKFVECEEGIAHLWRPYKQALGLTVHLRTEDASLTFLL